ncbi:hypothetical protein GCM10010182_58000 [Actinomadura cremea]|nr:hypothetical protein GCM10010182_58000 [Actinomadura cremea]
MLAERGRALTGMAGNRQVGSAAIGAGSPALVPERAVRGPPAGRSDLDGWIATTKRRARLEWQSEVGNALTLLYGRP